MNVNNLRRRLLASELDISIVDRDDDQLYQRGVLLSPPGERLTFTVGGMPSLLMISASPAPPPMLTPSRELPSIGRQTSEFNTPLLSMTTTEAAGRDVLWDVTCLRNRGQTGRDEPPLRLRHDRKPVRGRNASTGSEQHALATPHHPARALH